MTMTQKNPGNERIRGAYLSVFVKRANGVPMEEALRMADESGLVIASNKRLNEALVGSEEWRSIRAVFPCWSGTMTAYDRPDQELGKTIEYAESKKSTRFVFPVPEEHQGKKNVILVAEHPNFCLVKDGKDRIVQATEVDIVDRFPTSKEGHYLRDQKYDIPHGDRSTMRNPNAGYLFRRVKRVGLVARFCRWDEHDRRRVLFDAPSIASGVAVEAASADVVIDPPLRMWEQRGQLEETCRLIVEGTPGQIAAAARLLEQMKEK